MRGANIVIESRSDGNLLAKPTPLSLSFPPMFKSAKGEAALVEFHKALGDMLASLPEADRARAYATVEMDEDEPFLRFGYYRVETEEEYASRIATERAAKERYAAEALIRRRELYAELKAEFEGTG